MKNLFRNPRIASVVRVIKPWVTIAVFVLVLRYTGILAGISSITGAAIISTGVMDAEPEAPVVTKTFDYNFTLADLQNNKVDMNQFKGKTIFLNLWATWCGPCRIEMPSIQKLYDRVDHNKIAFVMLSLDRAEDKAKIEKFIADKKHSFPVYIPTGALPELLNVPSIPTTFVITPDGKVASKKVGTANYDTEEFQKFLEDLSIKK